MRVSQASQALGDAITGTVGELEALLRSEPQKYGWVAGDGDSLVFQMTTDGRHQGHAVELVASKTVIRGVEMVVLYDDGSYYCQA